jgi:hypothetical protein
MGLHHLRNVAKKTKKMKILPIWSPFWKSALNGRNLGLLATQQGGGTDSFMIPPPFPPESNGWSKWCGMIRGGSAEKCLNMQLYAACSRRKCWLRDPIVVSEIKPIYLRVLTYDAVQYIYICSIYCCTLCHLIFLDEDLCSSFGLCFLLKNFLGAKLCLCFLARKGLVPRETVWAFPDLKVPVPKKTSGTVFGLEIPASRDLSST